MGNDSQGEGPTETGTVQQKEPAETHEHLRESFPLKQRLHYRTRCTVRQVTIGYRVADTLAGPSCGLPAWRSLGLELFPQFEHTSGWS
jgi:hypothetical protein